MTYRLRIVLVFALLSFFCAHGAFAQEEESRGGFIGQGIAPIIAGDIAGARQNALEDAQKKSIIAAVSAELPAAALVAQLPSLTAQFFMRPDVYLARFKIINENTLPGRYQVTIQGFMQQDLLRRDLEALGVLKAEPRTTKLLLMIAQKDAGQAAAAYWWSTSGDGSASVSRAQQRLEELFIERGLTVVNPFAVPGSVSLQGAGGSAEPDIGPVCQLGAQLDASFVVLGAAELTRASGQQAAAAEDLQCNLHARVIDVKTQSVIIQAATYALGRQTSPRGALQEALDKACSQLSDQIADRFFQQFRTAREYVFRLLFVKKMTDEEVRQCMQAFTAVLPGLELLAITPETDRKTWTVTATSPAAGAGELQQMFGAGVAGYVTKIVSVSGNVITMRVTPIVKKY
jgi:hypothetical protein